MAETKLVAILYVVCAVCLVHGAKRSQTFYKHAGKHCVNKSASLLARSTIECCRACMKADTCTMVSFDNSSKMCEFSETDIDSTGALVTETGWDVYYKNTEVAESADVGCLQDWVAYENTCLYLDTEVRSRRNASSQCESLKSSAHLVHVKSEAKQNFITGWLQDESLGAHVWLGAMFDLMSEEYLWTDRTQFEYTFWYSMEPSHDDEHCVGAMHDQNFYWFDVSCDYMSYGVCEYTLN